MVSEKDRRQNFAGGPDVLYAYFVTVTFSVVFFPLIVSVAVIVVVPGFRPMTTTSPLGEVSTLAVCGLEEV